MTSKEIGILGEKIAEKYLKRKGYKILEKNYSPNFISGPQRGEIDIIAKKEDTIIFVEVKALRFVLPWPESSRRLAQDKPFNPEDKVDFLKQRKIIKTAESWLIKNKIFLESKWQIDILAIGIDLNKRRAKIRHLKNAVA